MPDITEMLQSNPEMADSLEQAPPSSSSLAVRPMTSQEAGSYSDTLGKVGGLDQPISSTPARARNTRMAQLLSNPDLEGSMETHHQAVADSAAFHHQTSQELALSMAAHALHDTAAFYQGAHAISASDPDYEAKMLDLAQKFPHAKPDAELMRPLHEARQTFRQANSAVEQMKLDNAVQEQMGKNNISVADLQNPAFRNQDGSLNHRALLFTAAARQSGQLPGGNVKLTPEEEVEWKASHVDPNYQKTILKATDNPADPNYNPVTATRKALFWSANRKLSPTAQPTAATLPDANKIFGGQ